MATTIIGTNTVTHRRTLPTPVNVTTERNPSRLNPIFRCRRCTHWSVSHNIEGTCSIDFGSCPCAGLTRELPEELRDQLDHMLEVSSS